MCWSALPAPPSPRTTSCQPQVPLVGLGRCREAPQASSLIPGFSHTLSPLLQSSHPHFRSPSPSSLEGLGWAGHNSDSHMHGGWYGLGPW